MTAYRFTVLALLAGAQTGTAQVIDQSQDAVNTAVEQTQEGIGDALLTPISDLNLKRKEIPPLLLALDSAYDPLPDYACETIAAKVVELEALLGPDVNDTEPEERGMGEKVGSGTSKAALDAVSGTTGGVIPFRGVVRSISGAAKHERRLLAEIREGMERRAYLKGMGEQLGCEWPAAPRKTVSN